MKLVKRIFDSCFLLEPDIYTDNRGFFYEFFNAAKFKEVTGLDTVFVQDNLAKSKYGVLRGFHFQKPPYEQAKLVSTIKGEILDVIVDIRPGSPTFLQHFSVRINEQNRYQLYIPRGFAHAYLSLAGETYVYYKTDNFYRPEADAGFRFNDPQVNFQWPLSVDEMIISGKDQNLPFIKDLFG
jgi:dTDP-4-dehydrorhamnose 3,5-epimerase